MRRTLIILLALVCACVMAPEPDLVRACGEACKDQGGMKAVRGTSCVGATVHSSACECRNAPEQP